MQPTDDSLLLRQYVEDHSDEAFAALVKGHINLVYSVGLRCVGDPHQAEEVAQAVFILLAKKAGQLRHEKALSSWLFQTTRFTASNFIRGEIRRHRREQEAHMQSVLNDSGSDVWPRIAPLLDDAVAELNEKDRQAIVLRFYEGRNLREVGAVMGASEDAAEKRVSRAVEKLRTFFTKRGLTVGASGLVGFISANAVQAAPIGLTTTITASATLAGKTITAAATVAATKAITMTILQKALVAAAVLATLAAGTGTYIVNHRNANRVRVENQTEFTKDSWTDAGFATPQAALRTRGWAVLTGNRERFKESHFVTDGARAMIQEMITATPISEAEKRLHPEFLSMTPEDAMLFPMMGQNKRSGFTGYRILSQKSLSADELILDIETQMASAPARRETLNFRRFGRDWKIVIDEDSMKKDYEKFQRMASRQVKSAR
jgi:RNA polymerase sigma factor (sigma-70 family)